VADEAGAFLSLAAGALGAVAAEAFFGAADLFDVIAGVAAFGLGVSVVPGFSQPTSEPKTKPTRQLAKKILRNDMVIPL
jgi:hypothetical protein